MSEKWSANLKIQLTSNVIQAIERTLGHVDSFGEVRLTIEHSEIRYIQYLRSETADWTPKNLETEAINAT